MQSTYKNWTYNQFLAFLLIHIASTDYKFSQDEINFIKSLTGDINFNEMQDIIANSSDYDIIQTIIGFKDEFYPAEKDKEKIVNDMKTLFLADGKFSINEQFLFRALSELFYSLK